MKKIIAIFLLTFIATCCQAEPKKLVVLLDWFANPDHAPLFVAKQQGFFKAEGLDVQLIGPADPSDPPKLVAAGKADIAITYEPQFIQQVNQGLPLIRIGTLIDQPLNCLAVLKESPIKAISDLSHKSIGLSTGEMGSVILKVILEKNGINIKDVNLINVHYDLTQALLSKKVDAVTGIMRNYEKIQMELAGHPVRIFIPEKNGIPTYSELIFVVNNKNVHDPRFKSFLRALQKGEEYLQKHPDETWREFAKEHHELNDELNKRAWMETLPYFTKNPAPFDKNKWQAFLAFMQQHNLITKTQPISVYSIDLTKDV